MICMLHCVPTTHRQIIFCHHIFGDKSSDSESVHCQRCLDFEVEKVHHSSLIWGHTSTSILDILFTHNFLQENWSFISPAVAILWTTFFLGAVPFPPTATCACTLASFSWFSMISSCWRGGLACRGTRVGPQGDLGRQLRLAVSVSILFGVLWVMCSISILYIRTATVSVTCPVP